MNDRHLPATNNVYGNLTVPAGLEQLAQALRDRLGLTVQEVYVDKELGRPEAVLHIQTATYEFATRPSRSAHQWLLDGAVAGDLEAILAVLTLLSNHLKWSGCKVEFEIYDDEFTCIATFP
jgi:hypothetical protein